MYTILHLSDLHRSSREPVTNETLIASLLADRDHYVTETPRIPPPDAIVVSGDVIQGALVGAPNWQAEVVGQYDVAHQFLSTLADRFVEGDRARVVILPGNHDVCWNTARAAMRQVAVTDEPRNMPDALFHPASKHRWSWEQRAVFRISDDDLYRQRLNAYWDFVERFYAGVRLAYPINRGVGFNLFELAGGKIVLAAFESLHGNDCFCFQGAIEDGVVARCSLALRDLARPYLLRMAAWHHSIQGPPAGTDYMDVQTVHEMTGNGFRLGLHGHQHQADAAAHYIHLPEQQAMAVVSAGSLCAGSRELPRGTDRQYNVIVINDDFLGARVHVREMQRGHQFGRCLRGAFALSGSLSLEWQRPTDAFGRPIDPVSVQARESVLRAEALLRSGDAASAFQLLESVESSPGSLARSLIIEAARATQRWDSIITLLHEPTNADELVALVEAQVSQRQTAAAMEVLAKYSERLALPVSIRDELSQRIDIMDTMRKSK